MEKFIYVFSDKDKDMLLAMGFELIQEDSNNGIYIFENDLANVDLMFSEIEDLKYTLSDTLRFS